MASMLRLSNLHYPEDVENVDTKVTHSVTVPISDVMLDRSLLSVHCLKVSRCPNPVNRSSVDSQGIGDTSRQAYESEVEKIL